MSAKLSRPFRTASIGGRILLFGPLQSPSFRPDPPISQRRRAQGQSRTAVALIVPRRRLISRPLLDWPRARPQARACWDRSRRPQGLSSRDRAAVAIPRAPDGYQTALDFRGSPRRVERVQQVQRRCPWARAMIASPYIRQLRYGLPLCCIHGQSRGKDGAHLHNGRLARPNLRWFSAATHPTRPTPT